MKITVTQEDINHAERRNACKCPIALAAKRIVGRSARVTHTHVEYTYENEIRYLSLNDTAKHFVVEFDGFRIVKPFEFEAHEVYI